ncbi:MAG: ABC transporter substrate-binding protein [Haloglomus sp.]
MTENESDKTRRKFLKATGGTALAAGIAGCSGDGGDGGGTSTPTATDTATDTDTPTPVVKERTEIVPGSTAVEKTGKYSFQIQLRDPFAFAVPVLAYSAFSIIPEGIVGDIQGYEGDMSYEKFSTSNPTGAGPFRFERWESGDGGEFAASPFEDYHGEPADFSLQDAIITSPTAQYNYFLNQNSDVDGIPTEKYQPNKVNLPDKSGQKIGTYGPLENGKTVNMARTPTINTFYVGFNMEKVPKAVRQAMAYVINRESFVKNVFKSRGAGAYHLTPTQIFPGGADKYQSHWQGYQGGSTGGGNFNGLKGYPYSPNQNDIAAAKQVMREAGYGPDNRFKLDWLQYQSPTWKQMANTIRSRLEAAYIDMNISSAAFGPLLSQSEKGKHEALTLGWIADYPAPQNFLQLVDPPNTVYDAEGRQPNGARLFWSKDAKDDDSVRQFMVNQFDRIQNNPGTSQKAQQIRADAAVKMEEGLWASAALLPVYHRTDDLFWYDTVDYVPPGAMGASRSKANNAVKSLEGDTLNGTSATFSSLDPIASGNTASGGKIMNMFDAPFNYPNASPEAENLLVKDFAVSDDLKTYEMTLKEGVQFQGDYGEVTADDAVYSIRRLVESPNSTNTYFPISVLNIDRETRTVTYTTTPSGE